MGTTRFMHNLNEKLEIEKHYNGKPNKGIENQWSSSQYVKYLLLYKLSKRECHSRMCEFQIERLMRGVP